MRKLTIKNITDYRRFYKEEVRSSGKNYREHYMGTTHLDFSKKEEYKGWFDIYHGDKEGYSTEAEGVKGYLRGLLDMARTGQAVYEFLQNAVDAESEHFMMYWDKDDDGNNYVIIANNGKMFNFDSIRSILNVGTSTKTSDSATIGKFGIGFKLAHRLVGEDSGLDEVVDGYQGPILFSWKNHEYQKLVEGVRIEHEEKIYSTVDIVPKQEGSNEYKKQYTITGDASWLFKILLTCFPVMPYEYKNIKKLKYIPTDKAFFDQKDLDALGRWIVKRKAIFEQEGYEEGSIFFIRLGKGKETEIGDKNLREGVKFSLAVLNETNETSDNKKDIKILKRVHLQNDEPINKPKLQYVKIRIDKEKDIDVYKKVRFNVKKGESLTIDQQTKFKNEANIEVLIGFRPYDEIDNYFEGAPNFYLYFPMSEEVHNYNFIIHSNAFYKGSSRTFLQKGTEELENINERLFSAIIDKMDEEFNDLLKIDRRKFLDFYAALLTSAKSKDTSRDWITKGFTDRFNQLLKKYIPYRMSFNDNNFEVSKKSNEIFIKGTTIDIDFEGWSIKGKGWFYWRNETKDDNFEEKALSKLSVFKYTIIDLLKNQDIAPKINKWLSIDKNRIDLILKEINGAIYIKPGEIKDNVFNLRMIEFSNGEYLSLNEFQEKEKEGYFIIYNKLSDIKDLLLKLGFKVSVVNFNHYPKIQSIFFNYASSNSQLSQHINKVLLFSSIVNEKDLQELSIGDKLRIFIAFRNLNDEKRSERLDELLLFKNKSGKITKIKNILRHTDKEWLSSFVIHPTEDKAELRPYLLTDDTKIYKQIIYSNWVIIFSEIIKKGESERDKIFEEIIDFYKNKSDFRTTFEPYLSGVNTQKEHCLIAYQNSIIEVEKSKVYYGNDHELGKNLTDDEYATLQIFIHKFYGFYLIDSFMVKYIVDHNHPFYLTDHSISIEHLNHSELVEEEIITLLKWCKIIEHPFFKKSTIELKEGYYQVSNRNERKQYYSKDKLIKGYIQKYLSDKFLLLPSKLEAYQVSGLFTDSKLLNQIVSDYTDKEEQQRIDLINTLSSKGKEIQYNLLNKITTIQLKENWNDDTTPINKLYLYFLKNILDYKTNLKIEISNKIELIGNEQENIKLKDIDKADDDILIRKDGKTYILSHSQIVNSDKKGIYTRIRAFAQNVVEKRVFQDFEINKLLKLDGGDTNESNIENEFHSCLSTNTELTNAHQFAYVFLKEKYSSKDYRVLKLNGELFVIEKQHWIINSGNEHKFYKNTFILHPQYKSLEEILKIQLRDTPIFNYDKKDKCITYGFRFLDYLSLDILNKNCDDFEMLKHLYECFKNTPNDKNQRKSKITSDWENYIGFNPLKYVLFNTKFSNEILPKDVRNWLNEGEGEFKEQFLVHIGVNSKNSSIYKLRQYLVTNEKNSHTEILSKIYSKHLKNTLLQIKDKKDIDINNSSLINTILEIQKLVIDLEGFLPLLVYQSLDKVQFVPQGAQIYYLENSNDREIFKEMDATLKKTFIDYFHILYGLENSDISKLQDTAPLKLKYDFLPNEGVPKEEDWNYYTAWKSKSQLSLIQHQELFFNLVVTCEEEEEKYKTNDYKKLYISSDRTAIHYVGFTIEKLSSELKNKGYNELASKVEKLIKLRDEAMRKVFSRSDTDNGKAIRRILNQIDIEEYRKELISSLKEIGSKGERYSFEWFEIYLDLLMTYKSSENTTEQRSIVFHSIEQYPIKGILSKQYFLLKGTSKVLPVHIESYSKFKVILTYRNRKKQHIDIESVSTRGQDLIVRFASEQEEEFIHSMSDVIRIKIEFTPDFNLLKTLKNAFIEDNVGNWTNIYGVLPKMHFIYGPPGTGKTTTLYQRIQLTYEGVVKEINNETIIEEGNPFLKVLVLTPTNKAADVIVRKFVENNSSVHAVRFSGITDPELAERDKDVYQDIVRHEDLSNLNLLASTVHRLPYKTVVGDNSFQSFLFQKEWDIVIFDECSMINLPYMVFALRALYLTNPKAKFFISGDPKQIPPVFDINDKELEELELADENIYKMMDLNDFIEIPKTDEYGNYIEPLTTQYRSVPEIGRLFSAFEYENKLVHHRLATDNRTLPTKFQSKFNRPITWIDFPATNKGATIYEPKKLLYSSYHVYASLLVTELIKKFDQEVQNSEDKKVWKIGIVAPYKAQAIIINKLVASLTTSKQIDIVCDTVHGFQGDERQIIIYIVNPFNLSKRGYANSLLSKRFIFNVAISRAEDYLWIVAPLNMDYPLVNELRRIHGDSLSVMSNEDVESFLFQGVKDYIERNSFQTRHDSVNVFGTAEMQYLIKLDENAIDFQIKHNSNFITSTTND